MRGVSLLVLVFIAASLAEKTYIDLFQPCKENTTVILTNMNSFRSKDGQTQLYSFDVYSKHRFSMRNAKTKVDIEKCSSPKGGCQPFPGLNLPSPCALRKIPNLPVKTLFDCINPPIDCSLEKGNYKGRNGVLDLADLKIIALGNYYWKANVLIYSAKEKYICFKINIHLEK